MPKPRAILVEDEPAAAHETRFALENVGFDVTVYDDAVTALEHADPTVDLVDLLVLDRRLPLRNGEAPTDAVGDELLTSMLQRYPDLVAVVFSGHTDFAHLQFATAGRGSVPIDGDNSFDRVQGFEKGQSLEFDEYVGRVASALEQLNDIQVIVEGAVSDHDSRLLRRVAREMGGSSITADPLTGGLTASPVWHCSIDGENTPTARVVAKRQIGARESGGFQTMCPAQLTAGTITVVRGFCGGYWVTVQQVVGSDPIPLLDLIASHPTEAARIAAVLRAGLGDMHSGNITNIRISEIARPFADWETVTLRAKDFDIEVPPGSKFATTVRSPQHGDLHPGNVLVVGEHPVLIDFDRQTFGSELLDVVALLLGPLFHRDSLLREGPWPTNSQCAAGLNDAFLNNCPAPEYFGTLLDWLHKRARSERELLAVVLAFTVRQLQYADVTTVDVVRERAIALARWAAGRLEQS